MSRTPEALTRHIRQDDTDYRILCKRSAVDTGESYIEHRAAKKQRRNGSLERSLGNHQNGRPNGSPNSDRNPRPERSRLMNGGHLEKQLAKSNRVNSATSGIPQGLSGQSAFCSSSEEPNDGVSEKLAAHHLKSNKSNHSNNRHTHPAEIRDVLGRGSQGLTQSYGRHADNATTSKHPETPPRQSALDVDMEGNAIRGEITAPPTPSHNPISSAERIEGGMKSDHFQFSFVDSFSNGISAEKRSTCVVCKRSEGFATGKLIRCGECYRHYHKLCHNPKILARDLARSWDCRKCNPKASGGIINTANGSLSAAASHHSLGTSESPILINDSPPGFQKRQTMDYLKTASNPPSRHAEDNRTEANPAHTIDLTADDDELTPRASSRGSSSSMSQRFVAVVISTPASSTRSSPSVEIPAGKQSPQPSVTVKDPSDTVSATSAPVDHETPKEAGTVLLSSFEPGVIRQSDVLSASAPHVEEAGLSHPKENGNLQEEVDHSLSEAPMSIDSSQPPSPGLEAAAHQNKPKPTVQEQISSRHSSPPYSPPPAFPDEIVEQHSLPATIENLPAATPEAAPFSRPLEASLSPFSLGDTQEFNHLITRMPSPIKHKSERDPGVTSMSIHSRYKQRLQHAGNTVERASRDVATSNNEGASATKGILSKNNIVQAKLKTTPNNNEPPTKRVRTKAEIVAEKYGMLFHRPAQSKREGPKLGERFLVPTPEKDKAPGVRLGKKDNPLVIPQKLAESATPSKASQGEHGFSSKQLKVSTAKSSVDSSSRHQSTEAAKPFNPMTARKTAPSRPPAPTPPPRNHGPVLKQGGTRFRAPKYLDPGSEESGNEIDVLEKKLKTQKECTMRHSRRAMALKEELTHKSEENQKLKEELKRLKEHFRLLGHGKDADLPAAATPSISSYQKHLSEPSAENPSPRPMLNKEIFAGCNFSHRSSYALPPPAPSPPSPESAPGYYPREQGWQKEKYNPLDMARITKLHLYRERVPSKPRVMGFSAMIGRPEPTDPGDGFDQADHRILKQEPISFADYMGIPVDAIPSVKDGSLGYKCGTLNPRDRRPYRNAPFLKVRGPGDLRSDIC